MKNYKKKVIGKATNIIKKDGKIHATINFNDFGVKLLKDIAEAGDPMSVLTLFVTEDNKKLKIKSWKQC